mmetsp:Transcript_4390/g.4529  ORF Transcript_4390/g.4529 Transcript_4390/m.4529 type:complete len:923 (-) Transcript_4390:423-3191(-)
MLALPLQRAHRIDLVPILKAFLNTSFGSGSDERFEADLTGFQRTRDTAIAVTNASEEAGLTNLLYVIFQLKSMAPRLDEYEGELSIPFSYQDAFNPSKTILCGTLYFDLTVFLWNYAALNSQIGSRIDRSTDQGIITAQKYFQQSAGAIENISNNYIKYIKENSSPINLSVLKMTKELMLAQAQLCFYEKAVKDQKAGHMKPGIIAKLAAQTGAFYRSTAEYSYQGICATYIDSSWRNHIIFQSQIYSAASEYWKSVSVKEAAQLKGNGYAEEIARLSRAESTLNLAMDSGLKNKLGLTLTNAAALLSRAVSTAKTIALNDNRTVYMESVPSDETLSPVAAVSLVKPSFSDYAGDDKREKMFFKDIHPKAVKALMVSTREKLDVLLVETTDLAVAATNEGRKQLSGVGLPGSVETYKSGGQFPENLWLKIERIQSLGGQNELNTRFTDLEISAKRGHISMESIEQCVDREERVDDAFRKRFPQLENKDHGVGPVLSRSSSLNGDIKINNSRLREAFDTARKNDGHIGKELNDPTFIAYMEKLSMDKEGLKSLLPLPPKPLLDIFEVEEGVSGSVDTSYLDEKLYEMVGLIDDREQLLNALKAFVSRDVLDSLSGHVEEGDYVNVVTSHFDEAKDIALKVDHGIQKQIEVLKIILIANDNFDKARETDPLVLERDEVIRGLEQGVSRFFTIHSQLTSGITFQANLQARLTSLLQSGDDLSYTQQLIRQEYEVAQTAEFERRSQETRDHEYATLLRNEMEGLSHDTNPFPSEPSHTPYDLPPELPRPGYTSQAPTPLHTQVSPVNPLIPPKYAQAHTKAIAEAFPENATPKYASCEDDRHDSQKHQPLPQHNSQKDLETMQYQNQQFQPSSQQPYQQQQPQYQQQQHQEHHNNTAGSPAAGGAYFFGKQRNVPKDLPPRGWGVG